DSERDLSGLRAKQRTLGADHVTQIEELHELVVLRAHVVDFEVELDFPRAILEMAEGGLAHGTEQDQQPRKPVYNAVFMAKAVERERDRVRAIEPIGERDHAALRQLSELLAPGGLYEAGHAALLPKRFRYASMNGSRSPSITFCTSPTLSSVRWSLTIVYGWNTYERIWLPQAISIFCLSTSAFLASRSATARSYSRALSIFRAVALFLNWLRSFWHCTTMFVGRCVIRTADDVLLTCCPPFPDARYTSMRRSSSLISISMSSSTTG